MAAAIVENPNWSLKQLIDFNTTYILNHDYFPEKSSQQIVQHPPDPKKLEKLNELEMLHKKLHTKPLKQAPKPWFDLTKLPSLDEMDVDDIDDYVRMMIMAADAARRARDRFQQGDNGNDDDNPGGPGPGGAWGANDPRGGPPPPGQGGPGQGGPDQGNNDQGPNNQNPDDDKDGVQITDIETLGQQEANQEQGQQTGTENVINNNVDTQTATAPETAETPMVIPTLNTQVPPRVVIAPDNTMVEIKELEDKGIVPELAVEIANKKTQELAPALVGNEGYHEIANKVPETITEIEKKTDDKLDVLNEIMLEKTKEAYNGNFFNVTGPGTIPDRFLESISHSVVPVNQNIIQDTTISNEVAGFENVYSFKCDVNKPVIVSEAPKISELPFDLRPIGQVDYTQLNLNKDMYQSKSQFGGLTKSNSIEYFDELLKKVNGINPMIKHLINTEIISERFTELARLDIGAKSIHPQEWYRFMQDIQTFNSKYCVNPSYYKAALKMPDTGLYLFNENIMDTIEFKNIMKNNEKIIMYDPADDVFDEHFDQTTLKSTFQDEKGNYTIEAAYNNWVAFKNAAYYAGGSFAAVGLSALIVAKLKQYAIGNAIGAIGGTFTYFMGRQYFGGINNNVANFDPEMHQAGIQVAREYAEALAREQQILTPPAIPIPPPQPEPPAQVEPPGHVVQAVPRVANEVLRGAKPGTSGIERKEPGYDMTRPPPRMKDSKLTPGNNDDDDKRDDDKGAEALKAIPEEEEEDEDNETTETDAMETNEMPPPTPPPEPQINREEVLERNTLVAEIEALRQLRMHKDILVRSYYPNNEFGAATDLEQAKLIAIQIKDQIRAAEARRNALSREIPHLEKSYSQGLLYDKGIQALNNGKIEYENLGNTIKNLQEEKEKLNAVIRNADPEYFTSYTSLNNLNDEDLYKTKDSIFKKENLADATIKKGLFSGNKEFLKKYTVGSVINDLFGEIDGRTKGLLNNPNLSPEAIGLAGKFLRIQNKAENRIKYLTFSSDVQKALVNEDYNVNFVIRRVLTSIEKAQVERQRYLLAVQGIQNTRGKRPESANNYLQEQAHQDVEWNLAIMRKFDPEGYANLIEAVTNKNFYNPKIYQTNDDGYLFWKFTPPEPFFYDYSPTQEVKGLQFESNILLARDAMENLDLPLQTGPIPDNQREAQEDDTTTLVNEEGTIEPDEDDYETRMSIYDEVRRFAGDNPEIKKIVEEIIAQTENEYQQKENKDKIVNEKTADAQATVAQQETDAVKEVAEMNIAAKQVVDAPTKPEAPIQANPETVVQRPGTPPRNEEIQNEAAQAENNNIPRAEDETPFGPVVDDGVEGTNPIPPANVLRGQTTEEFQRLAREIAREQAQVKQSFRQIFWHKIFTGLSKSVGMGLEAYQVMFNYILGRTPALFKYPAYFLIHSMGLTFGTMLCHAFLVSMGIDPYAIQQALIGEASDLYNPNASIDMIYDLSKNLVRDVENKYYNLDYENSILPVKTLKYIKSIFSGAYERTKRFAVRAKLFSEDYINPNQEKSEIEKFLKNYEILEYTNDASLEVSKKYYDRANDKIAYLENYRKDLNLAWQEYSDLFYASSTSTDLNEQKRRVASKLSDLLKQISLVIYNDTKDSVYIPQYFDTIVKQIDQRLTNIIIESRNKVADYYKQYNNQKELLENAYLLMIKDTGHPLWNAVYPYLGSEPEGYDVEMNPVQKYEFSPDLTLEQILKSAKINPNKIHKEDLSKRVSDIFEGKPFFHVFKNPEMLANDKYNEFQDYINNFKTITSSFTPAQRAPYNQFLIWRIFGSKRYEALPSDLQGLITDKKLVDFVTTAYGANVVVNDLANYNKQVSLAMKDYLMNIRSISEEDYKTYIRNLWFKYFNVAETASGRNMAQYVDIAHDQKATRHWLAVKKTARDLMSNVLSLHWLGVGKGRKKPDMYIKRKSWDILTTKPDKKNYLKKEIGCGVCNTQDNLYKIDNNRKDLMCKDCIGKGKRSKAGKLPAFLSAEKKTPIENDPVLNKLKNNRLFNKISKLYHEKAGDEHFDRLYENQTKHIPSEEYFAKGLPHEYHDYDHFSQDDKLNHLTKLFMKINLNKANDNEKFNYLRLGKHYIEKHGEGIKSPLNFNKINNFLDLKQQISEDPTKLFRINIPVSTEL